MLRQLFISSDKMDKADTESTHSSATSVEDKEMRIQIDDQESINQLWKELQQGAYQHAKSIHLSFHLSDAYQKISKLRRLDDTFVALGSLAQLEELCFHNADLLVTSLYKLLKKSSLKSIKFHNCTLIAKTMEHTNKLWKGIQLQTDLTTLEILSCSYTSSETLCRDRTPFMYCLPVFLQQTTSLQRLVLDECILDNDHQNAFANLLAYNTSLQELQIKPTFQVSTAHRRQQYQLRKMAIGTFMTQTIPQSLATNQTLRKLIVSLEDYQLEQVYVEAMTCWIEVVQHSNSTLQDLWATHMPLVTASQSDDRPDWYAADRVEDLFEYAESYLHHNLQSILRLNGIFQARKQQQEQQQQQQKTCTPKSQPQKAQEVSEADTKGTMSMDFSGIVTEIYV